MGGIDLFFRILLAGLLASAGWWFGKQPWLAISALGGAKNSWLVFSALGAAVGFAVAPYLILRPVAWLGRRLIQMPTPSLVAGIIGLLIALLMSALLTLPLSLLPGAYSRVIPLGISLLLIYVIVSLMLRRAGEIFHFLGLSGKEITTKSDSPILVDTSVLIDGRVADLSQTGFIMGSLVIPSFVLDELQYVADSSDPLRRRRGRRGMDMVTRLQKEAHISVRIQEINLNEGENVDGMLVTLAKDWQCLLLTTDFNLNRVAELQGVKVLNLNNLATALKPVVMPGEEMELRIIQEGTETGQGVGYLEDGTMVVVEGGKRHLNGKVDVVVSRVLQTAMGRMVFAQIKNSHEHKD